MAQSRCSVNANSRWYFFQMCMIYFWTLCSIHLVCVSVRIWSWKQGNLLCPLEQKRNLLKTLTGLQYLQEGQRIRHSGWATRKPALTSLEGSFGEETTAAATPLWVQTRSLSNDTGEWSLPPSPLDSDHMHRPLHLLISPNPSLMWGHLVGRASILCLW